VPGYFACALYGIEELDSAIRSDVKALDRSCRVEVSKSENSEQRCVRQQQIAFDAHPVNTRLDALEEFLVAHLRFFEGLLHLRMTSQGRLQLLQLFAQHLNVVGISADSNGSLFDALQVH
jgi:hypothetical protein